jgi:signal transduction histidine kinase
MQPATYSAPRFTRFAHAAWTFSQRRWRIVVIAMLALLHIAVFRGVSDPWARSLLLVHLGLVLLWQPFLRAEQRVSPTQGLIIALAAMGALLYLTWWLLAFWVVVLAGLVGGKVYQQGARWQRRAYLVTLAYLLALLAIAILPEIAPGAELAGEIRGAAELVLPLAFILIAVFPVEPESTDAPQIIDFFYSVFIMLLLIVVILGSFTFMTLSAMGYLEALTVTVLATAAGMLLVALAWNPASGAEAGVFFARYLFSIGLPLEKWLHLLTELAQREPSSERFLVEAAAALRRLPLVVGVQWHAGESTGQDGAATAHAVPFRKNELSLTVYSRYRTSPALHWHLELLAHLLAEFYMAKLREEELRRQSYVQAVHETGARLTHDIKNLLQSLNVLCSAVGRGEHSSPEWQALVRRQLPAIAERLASTLAKLQRPVQSEESFVSARAWWQALERQYRREGAEFAADAIPSGPRLPRSLFDSVTDNLLRNALAKRVSNPDLRIRVSLTLDGRITLRVQDSGAAIPSEVERGLLRGPVPSGAGLGIGLYQAARQAEAAGYRLAMEANRDGEVRFALTGPPA